jgi:hypothetical protein
VKSEVTREKVSTSDAAIEQTLDSVGRLFSSKAIEAYQTWLEVNTQLTGVTGAASGKSFARKNEIFRSGLNKWLDQLVQLVLSEVDTLSRIAITQIGSLGDADPAQWARLQIQNLLGESLGQAISSVALNNALGTSPLDSGWRPPPTNSIPAIKKWFRMASEGPEYPSWPISTKPWRAPYWCYQSFSVPLWTKRGKPTHLTEQETEIEIRSAQHSFTGRLEYVLGVAADRARVSLASGQKLSQEPRRQITDVATPVSSATPAEMVGSGRASIVATLIKELNALRHHMQVSDEDFPRLRDQHPGYEVFKICAEHPAAEKFVKLVNERPRINTLAYELAAIKCEVSMDTIKTAWKRYGKKHRTKR